MNPYYTRHTQQDDDEIPDRNLHNRFVTCMLLMIVIYLICRVEKRMDYLESKIQ